MRKKITPSSTTDLISAIKKLQELSKPKEIKIYGRSNNSIEKYQLQNNYSMKIKPKIKQYVPLLTPSTLYKQNMTDRQIKKTPDKIKSLSQREYNNDELTSDSISHISEITNKTSSTSRQYSQNNESFYQ